MSKLEGLLVYACLGILFYFSMMDTETIKELKNRVKCLEIINTIEFLEKTPESFPFLKELEKDTEENDSPLI